MEPISLIAVFIASLIGSPHCAGMCGGFVGIYSSQSDSVWLSHAAYNFGRLLTYASLGLIAGTIGWSANIAGEFAGFQRTAAVLTGLLLVFWGAGALLSARSPGTFSNSLWVKMFLPLHKRILETKENANWNRRAFTLGLVSTFLPCGWLYAFAALAAASGSPLRGILVMVVFWTGTLPVMASIGGIFRVLGSKGRDLAPRVTAALFILAGLFSLFGHMDLVPGMDHSKHAQHTHHAGP